MEWKYSRRAVKRQLLDILRNLNEIAGRKVGRLRADGNPDALLEEGVRVAIYFTGVIKMHKEFQFCDVGHAQECPRLLARKILWMLERV